MLPNFMNLLEPRNQGNVGHPASTKNIGVPQFLCKIPKGNVSYVFTFFSLYLCSFIILTSKFKKLSVIKTGVN